MAPKKRDKCLRLIMPRESGFKPVRRRWRFWFLHPRGVSYSSPRHSHQRRQGLVRATGNPTGKSDKMSSKYLKLRSIVED